MLIVLLLISVLTMLLVNTLPAVEMPTLAVAPVGGYSKTTSPPLIVRTGHPSILDGLRVN